VPQNRDAWLSSKWSYWFGGIAAQGADPAGESVQLLEWLAWTVGAAEAACVREDPLRDPVRFNGAPHGYILSAGIVDLRRRLVTRAHDARETRAESPRCYARRYPEGVSSGGRHVVCRRAPASWGHMAMRVPSRFGLTAQKERTWVTTA